MRWLYEWQGASTASCAVDLTFEIGASRDYGFSWAWDADSLSLLDAEMCDIGEIAGTNTDGGCATQYSNRESWRSNWSRLLKGVTLIHQRTRSEGWQNCMPLATEWSFRGGSF